MEKSNDFKIQIKFNPSFEKDYKDNPVAFKIITETYENLIHLIISNNLPFEKGVTLIKNQQGYKFHVLGYDYFHDHTKDELTLIVFLNQNPDLTNTVVKQKK